MHEVSELWLAHCEDQDMSETTIRARRIYLDSLEKRLGKPPIEASAEDMKAWYQDRRDDMKRSSLAQYVGRFRQFFDWAVEQGLIEESPAEGLSEPKPEKRIVEYHTESEINKLMAACRDNSPSNNRTRALFMWMYGTGCRVSETANLMLDDLNWEKHTALILGKGRKERLVSFSQVASHMAIWCDVDRPKQHVKCDNVFVTREGTPYTAKGINSVIKRLGQRAGLNAYPHKLRASHATLLHDAGNDIFAIAAHLGHSQVTTTQRYLGVSQSKIRNLVSTLPVPEAIEPTILRP